MEIVLMFVGLLGLFALLAMVVQYVDFVADVLAELDYEAWRDWESFEKVCGEPEPEHARVTWSVLREAWGNMLCNMQEHGYRFPLWAWRIYRAVRREQYRPVCSSCDQSFPENDLQWTEDSMGHFSRLCPRCYYTHTGYFGTSIYPTEITPTYGLQDWGYER